MIKILYFARLRDSAGRCKEALALPIGIAISGDEEIGFLPPICGGCGRHRMDRAARRRL